MEEGTIFFNGSLNEDGPGCKWFKATSGVLLGI